MKTIYQTFRDAYDRSIPNCEIDAEKSVTVAGSFKNDASLWVRLNKIRLIVVKKVNSSWIYYGTCEWTGAVAVKPDIFYHVKSDTISLSKGEYGVLMDFRFTTAAQTSDLFYQNGPFDLVFSR